ncbi:MAG: hypothetical protein IPH29_16140 [Candidatus Microthrix sp.]|nr:hypothetical protein [Candidatus Microthrix sp.]
MAAISEYGRDAMGVTVMRLDDDTKVAAVAPVVNTENGDDPADEPDENSAE